MRSTPKSRIDHPTSRWRPLPPQRHRFLYPGCSCCGMTGCSFCPAAPAQWRLTVTGISNAACSNCGAWNGEFVLTNHPLIPLAGGPCHWSSPFDSGLSPCPPGCSMCSRWHLVISSAAADLLADEGMMARYLLPFEDFDCLGTNVLERVSGTVWCNGWPDTVTLEPA